MWAAWRSLTGRGRFFLVGGVLLAAGAVVLGDRDVARIAVLLLVLPLLAAIAVRRTRYQLSCTHALEPPRVTAGGQASVVVSVRNVSRLPTGVMLVEDTLPYVLGGRPRFRIDRTSPGRIHAVRYSVRADARGRYPIGPLTVRISDPFGLVELARSFTGIDTLTVTPTVTPLPAGWLSADRAGGDGRRGGSLALHSADDAGTREYRRGDDLRRVHWRSTARAGELMVRREEQHWQRRAALLLDDRADAHRGDGPESSFEWAVAAAASIAGRLDRDGYTLRLVTGAGAAGGRTATHPALQTDIDILDQLADIDVDAQSRITANVAALRGSGADGGDPLLVAVLGALDPDDAELLATVRTGNTVGIALMLDTSTWQRPAHRPAGPRSADEGSTSATRATRLLVESGWLVLHARAGDALPDLWQSRSGSSPVGTPATERGRSGHSGDHARPAATR